MDVLGKRSKVNKFEQVHVVGGSHATYPIMGSGHMGTSIPL